MNENTEKYIQHLQGIVQIPTVSSVNDLHTDWTQFDKLHQFLQEAYPLICEKLEWTTIGKASLLFHWKSAHPKKMPVLFLRLWKMAASGDGAAKTASPF